MLNYDFSLPLCSVVTVVDVLSSSFFGLFTVREIKMFVTTSVFVSIIRTTEYSNSV